MVRFAVGLAIVGTVTTVFPVLAMRWVPPLTTSFMLRHGALFAAPERRCDDVEYRWVGRRAIAPAVFLAVIAAEDQRFAKHQGFDWSAIGDALEAAEPSRARGASTITQQVAKNLFLWPERSWVRKAAEAWITIWLELLWPKPRILEVYVNVAQFGRCTFGIGAASRRFFGTEPARVSAEQAALLAAVLPNPVQRRVEAPSPRVRSRAAWIARQARTIARSDWVEGLGGG
ncbi:MAG: monofunctional biosynthetic peptidoglycan transglycosylase [Proteobacteria bacterium]|nr:MAG: monofunctional biosynthetic peptidoglycan transglycosylase [Pseudomonadota bacterium]